jgi:hypothetical protein
MTRLGFIMAEKAAGHKKSKKTRRYQLQQKFWLNGLDEKELALAKWCDELRQKRRFAPVVRNSLMLMQALEQGDTAKLFQMFPNLYEQLYAQMEADVLERRENEAIRRLETLESLIKGIQAPALPAPETGGVKRLNIGVIPGPLDDDDDEAILTAVAATVDGSAIAANFLRSLQGI